jgi:glycosyltransferase involved in cell wall biosynthesis
MKFSIIVPVHNEAQNLEKLVKKFIDSLKDLRKNITEILLMENGSSDNTQHVCKKLENMYPGLIIAEQILIPSYGEALKKGILSSSGDIVCILECDAMDVQFIETSLKLFEQDKADFIVASKRHPESIDLRPFKRKMLTFLFNQWLKYYFHFPGSDTHGLKAIKTEIAKNICEKSITSGEIFQTEIVFLAHRMDYRVIEVPIQISEIRNTKVSIHRRLPKVINIIKELRQSLSRFPEKD